MKKTYKTDHPIIKTITEGDKLISYKGVIFELISKNDKESIFILNHIIVEDGKKLDGGKYWFPIDLCYKEKEWGIKQKYIPLKDKLDLL